MDRRLMSFAAALGVIALLAAGIAWAVETETLPDSGTILQLTYGPVPGTHKFKAPVEGRTGPLGQCVVCHSVEKNGAFRVAPGLWGIVGADKARTRWFGYSSALAKAEGRWTEKDLDTYLTKPNRFLPGTTKTLIGIADPKERQTIIAELKKLAD